MAAPRSFPQLWWALCLWSGHRLAGIFDADAESTHLPPGLLDSPPCLEDEAGTNPPPGIQHLCHSFITSPPAAVLPHPALTAPAPAARPVAHSPNDTPPNTKPNDHMQCATKHPPIATALQNPMQHTTAETLPPAAAAPPGRAHPTTSSARCTRACCRHAPQQAPGSFSGVQPHPGGESLRNQAQEAQHRS
jgi:hypothetical protein